MNKGLTPDQVRDLFGKYYKLIYNKPLKKPLDVVHYDSIIKLPLNDIFRNNNFVVIYYPLTRNLGHYVALFIDRKNKILTYYDPLGFDVDYMKNRTPLKEQLYIEECNTLTKRLYEKMKKENYDVHYNQYHHQTKDPNVAVCGFHCILRLLFNQLNTDEYNDMLNKLKQKFNIRGKYKDRLIGKIFGLI